MGNVLVDELFFFVFGIDINSSNDRDKKEKCAYKAYLDMCRTIKYKHSTNDFTGDQKDQKNEFEKQKKDFVESIINLLVESIDNYTQIESDTEMVYPEYINESSSEFDRWHYKLWKMLNDHIPKNTDVFSNNESLSFGQIQKWINMTIKYMRIMGILDEKTIPKADIHIPIDDYILTAAGVGTGVKICKFYDVNGLGVSKHEFNINNWSKISEYKKYYMYQNEIKRKCKDCGLIPIEWESKAWISESIRRTLLDEKEKSN